MSHKHPDNPFGQHGGELPDYSEEAVKAPVKESWAKDPRKKKFVQRAFITLLLLLALVPAYKQAKEWRASSLMKKSGEAFALGDGQKGLALLKQALALAPGSPRIQYAVELYNARSGDAESLDKLIRRMKSGQSDDQELLGIAEVAAMRDRKDLAHEALCLLPSKSAKRDFLRRSLLEASLKAREGSPLEAADFCLRRSEEAPSKDDSGFLRIQSALNLLSSGDEAQIPHSLDLIQGVIGDRSKASLAAWRIMTQLLLAPPRGIVVPDEVKQAGRMAAILPSLSGRSEGDELLAADLAIKANPDSKPQIAEKLIKVRQLSSRAAQLDLARWLNGRGFQKEVIRMAGADKPATDTDWLLVVLDAKSSLGDLDDIPKMISSPAGAGIQEGVRHLYLAKVAMTKGDKATADSEWANVGASLHLEKPEILAYIAGYEEQIGVLDRAAQTYRELANREETQVNGLVGLIRCQPQDASAKQLIPIYVELLAAVPDNQDASCDLAYLRLLAKEDVPEAAAIAEKLYQSQPNTLTRISTMALGRLRTGDARGALEVYHDKVIDWDSAPAPWKAVRVAVLNAGGETAEAGKLTVSINPKVLRPEERELLAPLHKDSK
jgi:tetratricopeptide (TPR) repeat protein